MEDKDHRSKWWTNMISKHGSVEAVQAFMSENAHKSNAVRSKPGGFATMDKERLSRISRRAAKKRWGIDETDTAQSQDTATEANQEDSQA